jgi:hypothetical protein
MELMGDMEPTRDSKIVVVALVAVTAAHPAAQAQSSTAQVLAGSY